MESNDSDVTCLERSESQKLVSNAGSQYCGDIMMGKPDIFKPRPGKTKTELNAFLGFFFSLQNSSKRDNLRSKLVRAHIKLMKEVMKQSKAAKRLNPEQVKPKKHRTRKTPRKYRLSVLARFEYRDSHELSLWTNLVRMYRENSDHTFDSVIKSGSGQHDSFNTSFFCEYFANDAIWNSFYVFLDMVFGNRPHPLYLIEQFNMSCCDALGPHDDSCEGKWNDLYFVLTTREFWTDNEFFNSRI